MTSLSAASSSRWDRGAHRRKQKRGSPCGHPDDPTSGEAILAVPADLGRRRAAARSGRIVQRPDRADLRRIRTGADDWLCQRRETCCSRGSAVPEGDRDPAVGRRIARQVSRLLLSPIFPIDQPFWIDRRSCAESEGMRSVNIS